MKKVTENNPVQPVNNKIPSYDMEFWLLRNVKENIEGVLQIAFRWYQLDDYLSELWKMLQAAIGNEKSAYEKGGRRIALLKFYDSLLLLMQALNAINETHKITAQTGNPKQKSLAETNLSTAPKITIHKFCGTYTWDYCRMELWDWMDAAISNNSFYREGLDRSFLLLEYQCIYSLVQVAYLLYIQYEKEMLHENEVEHTIPFVKSDVSIIIRHFFQNTPLKKATIIMQEFYSAWVHSTAAIATSGEHSEKLLFCEYITGFFGELHKVCGLTNENEK
jgi:hypothetical protein